MIFPEDMALIKPRFAAAGLTARLVEATDPDVEDDQIEIFRLRIDTRVTIQISLIGFCVNRYRGEGASLVVIDCGIFPTLRAAIDHAIETINSDRRYIMPPPKTKATIP